MIRKMYRVISVEVILEDNVLNMVSANLLQEGCKIDQKEEFWKETNKIIEEIIRIEYTLIGGDMNEFAGINID